MPQELLRNFILLFVLSWKNGEMTNCVSHFPAVSLHHVCCKILLFSGKYSPLLTAPFMKLWQPYCIFYRQDGWNEKASVFLAYYNRQLLTHHICLETVLTANAPRSLEKICFSFLSFFLSLFDFLSWRTAVCGCNWLFIFKTSSKTEAQSDQLTVSVVVESVRIQLLTSVLTCLFASKLSLCQARENRGMLTGNCWCLEVLRCDW